MAVSIGHWDVWSRGRQGGGGVKGVGRAWRAIGRRIVGGEARHDFVDGLWAFRSDLGAPKKS